MGPKKNETVGTGTRLDAGSLLLSVCRLDRFVGGKKKKQDEQEKEAKKEEEDLLGRLRTRFSILFFSTFRCQ